MSFEDVIGNVEIKDNVIITPDKRYVTIVEIAPINFDYKANFITLPVRIKTAA